MAGMRLTTDRLTLRHFTEQDMAALHLLLQDEAVNTFLPWFPMKNIEQTRAFYRARMAGKRYCFAVCFQGAPVGYIQADEAGCHDLGYALRREFWHRGFATEALPKQRTRSSKANASLFCLPRFLETPKNNNTRSNCN